MTEDPRLQAAVTNAVFGVYIRERHNPQLLLTDQRTPEKKRADDLVAAYRNAYPTLTEWAKAHRFFDSPLGEAYAGRAVEQVKDNIVGQGMEMTPTGRFTGGRFSSPEMQRMPAILPRGEAVMPLGVDYGQTEARMVRHYAIPRTVMDIRINVDASRVTAAFAKASAAPAQFAERMREHARAVSKLNDRMILLALFGDINLDEPEPGFKYERRLAKLLRSPDRRQRKRGERLFSAWYRTRKGINLYRGYSGK